MLLLQGEARVDVGKHVSEPVFCGGGGRGCCVVYWGWCMCVCRVITITTKIVLCGRRILKRFTEHTSTHICTYTYIYIHTRTAPRSGRRGARA